MRDFTNKIYQFSLKSIQYITLFLTLLLFLGSFLFTCYANDMTSQQVLTRVDNPFVNIGGSIVFCILLLILSAFWSKQTAPRKRILLFITLGWICIMGCILILFSKTVPAADAMSVYSAAEALANGDTSVIHPTDSYLSYYPQQVGLMAFLELLCRIWNLLGISMPAYHFIKGIYVLLLCLAVFFQYKSIHTFWENDTIDCIYLLLAGTNLPLIMYSSFVYGEIPSFTAFSVGMYFLIRFIQHVNEDTQASFSLPALKRNRYIAICGVSSLIFLTLSVMLRKNSLILIIAILIVLLLEGFKNKRASILLLALLCAICSFSILPLVQKTYEIRSGNFLKTGVPAMSYFAMGMQEASRGNGWYNGFNIDTYQNSGMDTELTNELSQQAIQERLDYFKQNPGYAIQFYWHKHLSQWSDGTYASRQATLATFGGRNNFFHSLYDGAYSIFYIEFYNIYQNILYLGALLFCISQCFGKHMQHLQKQKETAISSNNLALYIGLIGVIGGFLFHILWEANSRYIFIYSLLLMPYTAYGLSLIRLFFTRNTTKEVH